jgi:hypothetical protein
VDITALPRPSHDHATCAWCGAVFTAIVELLDHIEVGHVTGSSEAA